MILGLLLFERHTRRRGEYEEGSVFVCSIHDVNIEKIKGQGSKWKMETHNMIA